MDIPTHDPDMHGQINNEDITPPTIEWLLGLRENYSLIPDQSQRLACTLLYD